MNPARFRQLTDAYGGDLARWPAPEREAAQALASRGEPAVVRMLEDAAALDALLQAHRIRPPHAALASLIVARAPLPRPAPAAIPRRWRWGLGFAGLGAAGALAGVLVTAGAMPAVNPLGPLGEASWMAAGTVFGTSTSDWSDN